MLRSKNTLKLAVIAIAFMLGIISMTKVANAIESNTTNTTQTPTTVEGVNGNTPTTQRTVSNSLAKLETAKLQICKSRETEINTLLSRISDRGTKQADVFDKIATRVEAFYVSKGKPLSNYEELVAKVNSTKASVQSAVQTLSYSHITFSCDGDNPKAVITTFKQDLLTLNTALKSYRTAIKDLIVGVKSVQGTTTSGTNSNTSGGQQ